MIYFIDDLLTDPTLTVRLFNSSQNTLLGVSPLNTGFGFSISHDWSNTPKFSPVTSLMNAISGARESMRSLGADLSLGAGMLADMFSDVGFDRLSKALGAVEVNTNNNNAMVNAADYRKYYKGSDVSPEGVKAITLLFISGMTFNEKECNVRESIQALVNATVGDFKAPSDSSGLGMISAPNNFVFSGGFSENANGSFYISYGSKVMIPNLLVSGVEVTLSPLLTTTGDYYYATATVGLTPSRKFHKDDINKWLSIGG